MIWHCYLDSLLLLASLQVSCIIDVLVSLLLLESLLLLVSLRLLAVLLLTRHVISCRRLAVAGVCYHSVVFAMLLSTLLLLGVFCCCHPSALHRRSPVRIHLFKVKVHENCPPSASSVLRGTRAHAARDSCRASSTCPPVAPPPRVARFLLAPPLMPRPPFRTSDLLF
jgi:hypothetical protein